MQVQALAVPVDEVGQRHREHDQRHHREERRAQEEPGSESAVADADLDLALRELDLFLEQGGDVPTGVGDETPDGGLVLHRLDRHDTFPLVVRRVGSRPYSEPARPGPPGRVVRGEPGSLVGTSSVTAPTACLPRTESSRAARTPPVLPARRTRGDLPRRAVPQGDRGRRARAGRGRRRHRLGQLGVVGGLPGPAAPRGGAARPGALGGGRCPDPVLLRGRPRAQARAGGRIVAPAGRRGGARRGGRVRGRRTRAGLPPGQLR